jgi:putative transport protein
MIIEWMGAALRDHSELALFLALTAGYLLGRVRIGSFKLGPVVGFLLAGVAVGQIGIVAALDGCEALSVSGSGH